jgi:hypothetical protein
MSTPAIRAIYALRALSLTGAFSPSAVTVALSVLALLHLVLRVAADDQDHALPADDLAPLAAGLD